MKFRVTGRCFALLAVALLLISCSGAGTLSVVPPVGSLPMVSFVFDDGNDTDYLVGREIFAEHGVVASSAVTTGFINTPDHMTPAQLVALQDAGWEVMGHTVSHPNLKSLSPAAIEDELARSKAALEQLGLTINNIVYPYNKNSQTVREIAARYYRSGRGGTNSFNAAGLDPYFIRSFSLKHDIDRMKSLIDTAWAERQWLVLYQHEIDAKVKVSAYDGTFIKGEKLLLSPSGAVGRYVTTHWFPLYGHAIYLVPFSGVPRSGDIVKGMTSGATARVEGILYNEREQLAAMIEYIQKSYPAMPIVTIDQGLDLLGIPQGGAGNRMLTSKRRDDAAARQSE